MNESEMKNRTRPFVCPNENLLAVLNHMLILPNLLKNTSSKVKPFLFFFHFLKIFFYNWCIGCWGNMATDIDQKFARNNSTIDQAVSRLWHSKQVVLSEVCKC